MFPTPIRAHLRLAKYPPSQWLNKPKECTTKLPKLVCPNELSKVKSSDLPLLEISAVSASVIWVPTEARQAVSQISGQVAPLMCLTVSFINTTSYDSSDGEAGGGNSIQFTNCRTQHPSAQTNPVHSSPSLASPAGQAAGNAALCPASALLSPPALNPQSR